MAFNRHAAAQPATNSRRLFPVLQQLAALYRFWLPGAGVAAGNIHVLPPRQLAPNWADGAVVFSGPTAGEWVAIESLGSPVLRQARYSDLQYHRYSLTTVALTGVHGMNEAEMYEDADRLREEIVAALTDNTDLDGAVQELFPLRYTIGVVPYDNVDYFGLVLVSEATLRYSFARG